MKPGSVIVDLAAAGAECWEEVFNEEDTRVYNMYIYIFVYVIILMFWIDAVFKISWTASWYETICRCFCCLLNVSSVLCFIPYSPQRSSSQTFSCVKALEVEEIAPWPKRERSTPRTMVRGAPSQMNSMICSPEFVICKHTTFVAQKIVWFVMERRWMIFGVSVPSSSARSCPTDHQSLLFIASSSYLKPSMYTSIQYTCIDAHYFQQPLEKCIEMPWLGSVA